MLWHVRIPLKQKIMLMAIFSAAVVTVVVCIARVAVVIRVDQPVDMSWLYTWIYLELGICRFSFFFALAMRALIVTAIMIACVASFRQLFVDSQNSQKAASKQSHTMGRKLLAPMHSSYSLGIDSNLKSTPYDMVPNVELATLQPVHGQ